MTDNNTLVVTIIAVAILAAIVLTGIRRGTGSRDKSGELKKLRQQRVLLGSQDTAGEL